MLTSEQYVEKSKELEALRKRVSLVPDPLSRGVPFLNECLSEIQGCRDRAIELLVEAIWNKSEHESSFNFQQMLYDQETAKFMMSAEVQKSKSADMRSAATQMMMLEQTKTLFNYKAAYEFSKNYLSTVQETVSHLKIKNENFIKQIDNIRAQMNIDPDIRLKLKGANHVA